MITMFLAEGFEECEALIPLDMLRRVGIPVQTVGVGNRVIVGAHGIPVTADKQENELDFATMQGIILPGGMPGTKNLEASQTVQKAIDYCAQKGLLMAAICAAPSVLGHKGLLNGKKATCFPGFEADCVGATMTDQGAVIDGNIITARGAGCGFAFGKALVTYLKDAPAAEKLLQDMQWNYEGHSGV